MPDYGNKFTEFLQRPRRANRGVTPVETALLIVLIAAGLTGALMALSVALS